MIDHDALDDVEEMARAAKRELNTDLGDRYVPGEGGNPTAFIVGEAPGAQEDIALRPFIGPAGDVLRQLMEIPVLYATSSSCGPPYEPNCWLTNVVKFRPPRNRTPFDNEISAFRPVLRKEWQAVGCPQLIIPVGGVALQAVTGRRTSILKAAGKCHKVRSKGGRELYVWPMVHPSFGLRAGEQVQELLEKDWEALAKWLVRHDSHK